MAWIYFQESEASASHSSLGSEQSHTVKETDTLKLCCCREWLLTNSTELLSGTTLHRSTGPCYQVLTSSSEGSHARTSVLQGAVMAWVEAEAVFTRKSKELSGKQIQLSSFLKTSLRSGLADLVVWCGDWPRSGMIVDGRLFLPPALEPRTCAKDGSCWLPTPSASSVGTNQGGGAGRQGRIRPSLETMARKNLWPTPKASDSNPCGMQAMLRYNERTGRKTLITEVAKKMWPTPRASEAGREPSSIKDRGNKTTLCEKIGGQLNPMWVEWLMGFHPGWTELDAWAIQWFRSKREKRSKN